MLYGEICAVLIFVKLKNYNEVLGKDYSTLVAMRKELKILHLKKLSLFTKQKLCIK